MTQFQLDTSGLVAKPGQPGPAPNNSRMQCTACGRDNRGYKGDPCSDDCPSRSWAWDDLSPFTQGYVEALFATFSTEFQKEWGASNLQVRFSDLAPETLARIIADCEVFEDANCDPLNDAEFATDDRQGPTEAGAAFWLDRQGGAAFEADWPEPYGGALTRASKPFPPLTVQLGDDGKVRFA